MAATHSAPNIFDAKAADVTGDGLLDAVFFDNAGHHLYYLANDASGDMVGSTTYVASQGEDSQQLFVADIDSNNSSDVLMSGASFLRWYSNDNGDGTTWTQNVIQTGGNLGGGSAAHDLNNDNHTDVIYACLATEETWVRYNDGSNAFGAPQLVNDMYAAWYMYASDINNDGFTDWYTSGCYGGTAGYTLNYGNGTFETVSLITSAGFLGQGLASDLDQDGDSDFVVLDVAGNSVVMFWNLHVACSDNVTNGFETCDDGNLNDLDGCNSVCGLEFCGDGILNNNNTEQCDDGNTASGDGCDSACQVECPDGFVSLTGDFNDCTSCPQGQYRISPGEACGICPGSSTTPGESSSGVESCACPPGMFGASPEECEVCPDGGLCVDYGTIAPVVAPGYWSEDTTDGINIYPCPSGTSACPGGDQSGTCNLGYEGFLCSDCADNYYYNNGRCVECSKFSGSGSMIAAGVAAVVFVAFRIKTGGAGSGSLASLTTLSIVINFAQIQAILASYTVPWPPPMLSLFSWLSIANFNIEVLAPECSVELTYHEKLKAKILGPAVFVVLILVLTMLGGLVSTIFDVLSGRKKARVAARYQIEEENRGRVAKGMAPLPPPDEPPSLLGRGLGACTTVLVLMYNMATMSSVDLFRCTEYSNGSVVLTSTPTVACYDSQWYEAVPFALAGLAMYTVGVPLILGFGFIYGKKKHGASGLLVMKSSNRFWALVFGSLTMDKYMAGWFWFELVVLMKKLVLGLTTVFGSVFFQTLTGFLVCFAFIVLQAAAAPYTQASLNTLELWSAISSFLTLFSAILFSGNSIPDSYSETLVVVIVVLGVIITLFVSIYSLLSSARELRVKSAKVAPGGADEAANERQLVDELVPWIQDDEARRAVGLALSLAGERDSSRVMKALRMSLKASPSMSILRGSAMAKESPPASPSLGVARAASSVGVQGSLKASPSLGGRRASSNRPRRRKM